MDIYFNAATGFARILKGSVDLTAAGEEPNFVRGDVDANGALQLADGINFLVAIFLGNFAIPCDDAADVDNNGVHQLADGINFLVSEFLGGYDIPPPTVCGADPTDPADSLGCASLQPTESRRGFETAPKKVRARPPHLSHLCLCLYAKYS